MKKKALMIGMILSIVLEVAALAGLYDIHNKVSTGGDIFHNNVDNLPMKVGGEDRRLSTGTYVMTREGPVLLPLYWLYEYSYLTASLPILSTLILLALYLRSTRESMRTT